MPDDTPEVEEAPVTVVWHDETYELAQPFPWMAYALFGQKAGHGGDTDEMDGLAAVMDFLEELLTPDDWQRFTKHSKRIRAGRDDNLELIGLTFEALTARPTVRPADSSDGPQPTSESSTGDLSSQVIDRLKDRPDLQRQVAASQERQRQGLRSVG